MSTHRIPIHRMLLHITLAALAVVLATGLAPSRSAHAATWTTALVTCDSDDAKIAPDINAQTLATYYRGQTVTVTGERSADGIWARVVLGDGRLAWMKVVCVGTGAAPTPPTVTGPNVMITTGALNVRSGPGWWYSVLGMFYRGTVLPLGSYRTADATWVQVVMPQGQVGWVNTSYVTAGISLWSLPVYGAPVTPTATVVAGSLNVRSGPGWNYGILGTFYQGTSLTLGSYRTVDSLWVQVVLAGGITGWVNTAYVVTSVPLGSLPVGERLAVTSLPVYGATPPPPPPPVSRTHVVQSGENLYRIGLRYGVNWLVIAAANGIGYPYNIYAGQALIIP